MPVPVAAFYVLPRPSMLFPNLWRGVKRRRIFTEIFVARFHILYKTPFAQVDRYYLPAGSCRPISLDRIDLEILSQEF